MRNWQGLSACACLTVPLAACCVPAESFVYKAFNTVGVEHMARPDGALVTGTRMSLPFAGAPQRQRDVAALIEAVGFEAHWVGHVRYARNLEALAGGPSCLWPLWERLAAGGSR